MFDPVSRVGSQRNLLGALIAFGHPIDRDVAVGVGADLKAVAMRVLGGGVDLLMVMVRMP